MSQRTKSAASKQAPPDQGIARPGLRQIKRLDIPEVPPPPPASEHPGAALTPQPGQMDMAYLVKAMVKYGASDMHIRTGRPPLYRINGRLIPAKLPELRESDVQQIIYSIVSAKVLQDLETRRQVDFSFGMSELGRFRANVFFQRNSVAAVVRTVPLVAPKFDTLGIPPVLKKIVKRKRGLVLITGPSGSGKSTTLAALVQHINETRYNHILTVEDPIEFSFRDLKSTITQRQVGSDTPTFDDAIKAGLRQDPDVVMIGEMRDLEVIRAALTAAETGNLVVATLHTSDARSTLERIIDVFPEGDQNQVRIQLASSLLAVVSQRLAIRADGKGRIPACEVMVNSPTVERLILRNELQKIPEAIAASNNYYKMQSFNQDYKRLVSSGMVKAEDALKNTDNPDDLALHLSGVEHEEGFDQ